MGERSDTKERIAQAALALFARRGYAAVSIRDLCREVGVKESTIYYHYVNKQAILDELMRRIDERVEGMRRAFDGAFEAAREVTDEAMRAVAVAYLKEFLLNPYVYSVISMLSIERMSDAVARQAYRKLAFDVPLEQQRRVFRAMMDRGFIAQGDADALAETYCAVLYIAFEQHCLGGTPTEEEIARASEQIARDVGDLYRKIKKAGADV